LFKLKHQRLFIPLHITSCHNHLSTIKIHHHVVYQPSKLILINEKFIAWKHIKCYDGQDHSNKDERVYCSYSISPSLNAHDINRKKIRLIKLNSNLCPYGAVFVVLSIVSESKLNKNKKNFNWKNLMRDLMTWMSYLVTAPLTWVITKRIWYKSQM